VEAVAKVCLGCGETKPLEDFHLLKTGKYGRHPQCARCRNERQRGHYQRWTPEQREAHRHRVNRSRYGIDPHLLRELYEMQEGCCAVCGAAKEFPVTGEKGRKQGEGLVIDHSHADDKVRGLLCWDCNVGLGKFRDSPETLVKAAAYLIEGSESDRDHG